METKHDGAGLKPVPLQVKHVEKLWGSEFWIVNNEKYCSKILHFEKGKRLSMHFHKMKDESWYLLKGKLMFYWIDTTVGKVVSQTFDKGQAVRIPPGLPHQLLALEDSDVIETSTQHFDSDSYRIYRGSCSCSCSAE